MNLAFDMEKNCTDMEAKMSLFSVLLRFAPKGGWEAFYAKHPESYEGYNYSDEEEEESGDEYEFDNDDGFDYDYNDFPYGYHDGYGHGYGFGFGYGYNDHGHGYHSPWYVQLFVFVQ